MKIGNWDSAQDVLIVAEIGNNHEGSYTLAEEMIGRAAGTGVSAVKFQVIVPERLISPGNADRLRQLEKFRLSYNEFEKLSRVAEKEGVLFLATPFDIESALFLESLVPAYKIASGDNNFFPLIEVIAGTGKPVILSSGLANMAQIRVSVDFIRGNWWKQGIRQELAVLHCVAAYPTPAGEANLLAIRQLQVLGTTVGYSDHTLGIEAAVLSVALGARIIEKHFTLDKNYSEFRDHRLSADPQEMARLVLRVREAAELLGTGDKLPQAGEQLVEPSVRRSIVARHDLPAGKKIERDDIDWVRPANGLSPGQEHLIIGRSLTCTVKAGEPIIPEMLSTKRNGLKVA